MAEKGEKLEMSEEVKKVGQYGRRQEMMKKMENSKKLKMSKNV